MIKNYFKTAYRSLLRNKAYTIINVLGLSLGISCCLIIFLLVKFELSYEDMHSKKEDIYRVTGHFERDGATYHSPFTPFPMAEALRNDFPELINVTQTYYNFRASIRNADNDIMMADHIVFADEEYLSVFDFELIEGNRATCLRDPNTIVITKSTSERLFGERSPIGEIVEVRGDLSMEIRGVMADPPKNIHQPVDLLISYTSFNDEIYELDASIESWDLVDMGFTYVVLNSNQDPDQLEELLVPFTRKYHGEKFLEYGHYQLQPLGEIHFDTRFAENNISKTVDTTTIMGFMAIGLVLLLAACINFINLSTAQSVQRSREVGVRKVMGAIRGQLIYQFLGETLIITFLSAVFSIIIVEILLPISNSILGQELSLNLLGDGWSLGFLLSLVLIVTLLGGIYPAFILSGFKPVQVLRAKAQTVGKGGLSLRKFLVITQFLIAQILIISTVVTYKQVEYFKNKPMGFEAEQVINFGTGVLDSAEQQLLKNKLLEHSDILEVSWFSSSPTNNGHLYGPYRFVDDDNSESIRTTHRSIDDKYLETFGLELIAGTNIKLSGGRKNPGILVNETLLKQAGVTDPASAVGRKLKDNWLIPSSTIVGVVKDFHNQSLHREIIPTIFFYGTQYHWRAAIKLNGTNTSGAVAHLEDTFNDLYPNGIFNYQFEDQRIAEYYENEDKLFEAFQSFAVLAIVICSLGLFGLVSFVANQKVKEVGIRKVLGASLHHVLLLFGSQFFKPLMIAFLIAIPIGYFTMDEWLSNFVYRQDVGIGVFLITIVASFLVAGITVSYHSLKAANTNPVDSLRYE